MVEIAVAQFSAGQDKRENHLTLRNLVGEAVSRGAQLVVAPE